MARSLIALLLALAMPAQWDASCAGWQSSGEAVTCCQRAAHDDDASAARGCCSAQEQARHAHAPIPAVIATSLVPAAMPVPALAPAPCRHASTHRAGAVDSRLLASVFLI